MDSILVFDDFKHCFRELDTSNYNDDLVVGSVFFTRDAINVIEKYYRIIVNAEILRDTYWFQVWATCANTEIASVPLAWASVKVYT